MKHQDDDLSSDWVTRFRAEREQNQGI
jgi:LPS sulfotransferase NodH